MPKNLSLLCAVILFVFACFQPASAQTASEILTAADKAKVKDFARQYKAIPTGIINGRAIKLPTPTCPTNVDCAGIVKAIILIDENGKVIKAQIISGDAAKYEFVLAAARETKFTPTTDLPLKVAGILVYNFGSPKTKNKSIIPMVCDGGVLNGKATELPLPVLTYEESRRGEAGTANVRVTIDEQGNVVSATACGGHPVLRDAAVAAALKAKFEPTTLVGQPARVSGIVIYDFRKDGKFVVPFTNNPAVKPTKIFGGFAQGFNYEIPQAEYPMLRTVQPFGSVVVNATVDENGKVASTSVVSGHPLLRPAATAAARQARFKPFMKCGKPAHFVVTIQFSFNDGQNTNAGFVLPQSPGPKPSDDCQFNAKTDAKIKNWLAQAEKGRTDFAELPFIRDGKADVIVQVNRTIYLIRDELQANGLEIIEENDKDSKIVGRIAADKIRAFALLDNVRFIFARE